jgi:hypothetical protein
MAGTSVEIVRVRPKPVSTSRTENRTEGSVKSVEFRLPEELLSKFDQTNFSEFQRTYQLINSEEYSFDSPAQKLAPNIVDNTPEVTYSVLPGYLDAGFLPDGTPLIADLRYYSGYAGADADFKMNGSNCTFFHTSMNFLMEAAKQYATISDTQEFLYRPTMDYQLVNSTIDFFLGDKASAADYQAMHDSVDKIVRELANRIKKGESTDLSTLKNKLSIAGEEISIDQFRKIQQISLKLVQGVQDRSFGTCSIIEFAKKGLRTAAAGFYGESLPGSLGEKYREGFGKLMDRSCESNLNVYRRDYSHFQDSGSVASSLLGPKAYTLFSGIATGSKNLMNAGLKNVMSAYEEFLNKTGFTVNAKSCEKDLYEFLDSLMR